MEGKAKKVEEKVKWKGKYGENEGKLRGKIWRIGGEIMKKRRGKYEEVEVKLKGKVWGIRGKIKGKLSGKL